MRRWIGMLMVVALVLRGLVPTGFMPALSADGGVTVVICTEMGVQHLAIGKDDTDRRLPKSAGDDCPFCSANVVSVLPQTPSAVAFTFAVTTSEHSPFVVGLRPPVRAGPAHGSRAPPALS